MGLFDWISFKITIGSLEIWHESHEIPKDINFSASIWTDPKMIRNSGQPIEISFRYDLRQFSIDYL